jgi:hypothetical protein
MTAHVGRLPHLTGSEILLRALGLASAALFAIDAYVHFDDAGFYDFDSGGSITQGSLFRIEASVAIVVGLALLVWPHWVVWVVAVLVAGSAAGAVYLYTYVDVGSLGPLPDMYEPTWALPGKRASAVAESVATGLSAVGLAVALYARRQTRDSRRPAHEGRLRRAGSGGPGD